MNQDEIVESINSICAPLSECKELRDRVIEEIGVVFDALKLASAAYAKTQVDPPTEDTIVLVRDKFIRRVRFDRREHAAR